MPDCIDWQMDGGDLGSVTLVWRIVDGEPVFLQLELGRGHMEPRDAIDALWDVVPEQRPFEAHRSAVRRWIDARGWDAMAARASAADTAACERAHHFMENGHAAS